jgi:hypothetical protein
MQSRHAAPGAAAPQSAPPQHAKPCETPSHTSKPAKRTGQRLIEWIDCCHLPRHEVHVDDVEPRHEGRVARRPRRVHDEGQVRRDLCASCVQKQTSHCVQKQTSTRSLSKAGSTARNRESAISQHDMQGVGPTRQSGTQYSTANALNEARQGKPRHETQHGARGPRSSQRRQTSQGRDRPRVEADREEQGANAEEPASSPGQRDSRH